MPVREFDEDTTHPWHVLRDMGDASPWREVVDEYTGSAGNFQERHYNEFVSFLPYVQRFLYGEGRSQRTAGGRDGESPMRVFRRKDIASVRLRTRSDQATMMLDVVHIDLYFFLHVNLVLLNVEVSADDISLAQAQDLLHRFGRGYPPGWDSRGAALNCMAGVQWLNAEGKVLASSDAQKREQFLEHVSEHRAPRISAHWAFLLEPMVSHHSDSPGLLRYRQIEYYRMPVMGYLALDNPLALSRSDFIRLGLVTGAGQSNGSAEKGLPYAEQHLRDFEQRYCYDRFWTNEGAAPNTRYLCSGHALVVVGDARSEYFSSKAQGVLAQFRHQHFLLFLIAHFQKAALIMYSDRLVEAMKLLNLGDPKSMRYFKRAIHLGFESFLRFTHRYWFHEVSAQTQTRELFRMCSNHLKLGDLYNEVKARTSEMNDYLDGDSQRRQANTVTRLTVVTIFGMIGTITTGFLGMNLLAEADAPVETKLTFFAIVTLITTVITAYTMMKSKRLSEFLDALTDERVSIKDKCRSLTAVWEKQDD